MGEGTHLVYLSRGFYVAFNTIQVISRWVVGRAEETSTYSSLGLCTVNCRPTVSNYQLSHIRPSQGSNPGLRGGRQECYHSATMAPFEKRNVSFAILDKYFFCQFINPLPHTSLNILLGFTIFGLSVWM